MPFCQTLATLTTPYSRSLDGGKSMKKTASPVANTTQHHSKWKRKEHLQTLSCRTAEVLLTFARAQFRGAPVVAGPGAPQDGPDISWYAMIQPYDASNKVVGWEPFSIYYFIHYSMIDWLVMHYLQVCSFASIWPFDFVYIPSSCSMKHGYLAMTSRGLRKCPAGFWSRGDEGVKLGIIKDGDRLILLSSLVQANHLILRCGFHGFWSFQELARIAAITLPGWFW